MAASPPKAPVMPRGNNLDDSLTSARNKPADIADIQSGQESLLSLTRLSHRRDSINVSALRVIPVIDEVSADDVRGSVPVGKKVVAEPVSIEEKLKTCLGQTKLNEAYNKFGQAFLLKIVRENIPAEDLKSAKFGRVFFLVVASFSWKRSLGAYAKRHYKSASCYIS